MNSATPQKKILIVNSSTNFVELVQHKLLKNGYLVITAETGAEAIRLSQSEQPDLIIMDQNLPDIEGHEVCRNLKKDPLTNHILITMLHTLNKSAINYDRPEYGADDYISRPFSIKVLLSRINAIFRKSIYFNNKIEDVTVYLDMKIHPSSHNVIVRKMSIQLTITEFQILHFLAKHQGYTFTRSQIVDAVKGIENPVTDRTIDVHIVAIRKKLGEYGSFVQTVRGIGYRMKRIS